MFRDIGRGGRPRWSGWDFGIAEDRCVLASRRNCQTDGIETSACQWRTRKRRSSGVGHSHQKFQRRLNLLRKTEGRKLQRLHQAAEAADAILLPALEFRTMRKRREPGVPIDQATRQAMHEEGQRPGVDVDSIMRSGNPA